MIYLIQIGVQLSEPDAAVFESKPVLKIGYTSDTSFKRRLEAYKSHCGDCVYVLSLIEGGTREDESALHSYFKSFLFKGREWFDSADEILKFFKENDTIEKVREALPEAKPVLATELRFLDKVVLNQRYCLIFRLMKEEGINYPLPELKKFIKEKLVNSTESLFAHLSFKFPDSCDKLKDRYNEIYTGIAEALDTFNNNAPRFEGKMKLVCELSSTMDSSLFPYFLASIPQAFSSYLSLGVDRCQANCYRNKRLMVELKAKFNNQERKDAIKEAILDHFEVGKKYTRTYIKQTLRELYIDFDYQKHPKAVDLEEYFNVKICKVVNSETKRRDACFLLLSLKEE